MKHRLSLLIITAVAGLMAATTPLSLAQTSSNYKLTWWTFDSAAGKGASTNYALHSNLGQFGVGQQSSSDYRLSAGFLFPSEVFQVFLPLVMKNSCSGGWEIEPNNAYTQTTGLLDSGETICGYPNDNKDYFSFTTTSAGAINVNLDNHTGSGVQLQLFYGPPGTPVVYDYAPPYQINYNGAAGTYYVYIYTSSGFNSDDPGYDLTVTYP